MSGKKPTFVKKLTADKKKFWTLTVLAMVGLLLWGRLMIKKIPRTAVADPQKTAQTTETEGEDAAEAVSLPERRVVVAELAATLGRDLFHLEPTLFPQVAVAEKTEQPEPKDDPRAADKEQLEQELKARLATLRLQTTLFVGGQPQALINGKLVTVGQTIDGFEVKQIFTRQVVLQFKGMTAPLKMDQE